MSNVKALTEDTFKEHVGEGYAVVDFWAAWCGPCRVMSPIVDEFARDREDVKVGKVDIDANQNLASAYGIYSIPTMVVLKDGVEVDRIVGVTPLAQFTARVDAAVKLP